MPQKIAIVEDDLAISHMYRVKFENEGYDVNVANGGNLGIQMVQSFKPDILLLDLMMPDINGDEVLRKIRSLGNWGKQLKVIILTNTGREEAPTEIENLNILDYIVKADMTPRQVAEIVKTKLA